MNPNDLVILNQAKALEGMRQRLRSHGKKLTEGRREIDRMKIMIDLRDEKIAKIELANKHLYSRLQKMLKQVPESELTRKCEELAKDNEILQRALKTAWH